MRADLAALFQHDDGKLRIDLLEPDRRGKTRRPGANDHHVEFHVAFDFAHSFLRTGLALGGPLLVINGA
jgi:hypothetical protein